MSFVLPFEEWRIGHIVLPLSVRPSPIASGISHLRLNVLGMASASFGHIFSGFFFFFFFFFFVVVVVVVFVFVFFCGCCVYVVVFCLFVFLVFVVVVVVVVGFFFFFNWFESTPARESV